MATSITVHHLEYSQSFRIVWLLEELEADYELKIYKRTEDHLAPAEYKDMSPLGTSPTVEFKEEGSDSVFLCETNAIIDAIIDMHPKSTLRPPIKHRQSYLFWFHASQGSFQPLMSWDSLLSIIPKKLPFPLSSLLRKIFAKVHKNYTYPRLEKILGLAEEQLTKTPYFNGDELTAADVSMIYPMESCLTRHGDEFNDIAHCEAWMKRCRDRPAFKRAQEKVHQDHVVFSPPK